MSLPAIQKKAVCYGRPLPALSLAFIAGIVLGARLPGYPLAALGVISGCLGLLIYHIWRVRSMRLTPLLLFLGLGYLALQPWLASRLAPHHIAHLAEQQVEWVEGIILDIPHSHGFRTRLHLAVSKVQTAGEPQAAVGKLRVNLYGPVPTLQPGKRLRVAGRLRAIRGFRNPGGFDYERFMAFQRIRVSLGTSSSRIELLEPAPTASWQLHITGWRHRLDEVLQSTVTPPASNILRALLVGNRQAIPHEWREQFNRAGVSHILAISGLHLSIVAGSAFVLWRGLLAFIPWLLWRGWGYRLAALLTLPPLLTYALLAGMSPATQRALVMAAVFLLALMMQHEHDSFNTLSLAALAILVIHPPMLYRIAFQLSFAAVITIMTGMHLRAVRFGFPLSPEFSDLKNWLKHKTADLFRVSLLAILGTLPLVMYYFNQAALAGIVANMLIVPLIGFLVVPAGLLALLVNAINVSMGGLMLSLTAQVVLLALHIIEIIAAWPWAAFRTVTPSMLEITCYYALLGTSGYLWYTRPHSAARREPSRSPAPTPPPLRAVAGAILILALVMGALNAGYWYYQRFGRNDLRLTVIDVGQGSSTLVELPRGKVLLIDGGGFSDNEVFDVGAFVVAPVLWRKKIRTIDKLILSHPDSDHLNGLLFIADNFNVRTVWTNGEAVDTRGYQHFEEIIRRHNLNQPDYVDLPRTLELNGVTLELLYPPVDFLRYKSWQNWRNPNNNSLVLRLTHGRNAILFSGDIEARGEFELVALQRGHLQSNVLLAPHHGSRTSSQPYFLDEVNPSVVLISAGWTRREHFPHPEVVQRYQERGYQVFNTADHGAIRLVSDGIELKISTLR